MGFVRYFLRKNTKIFITVKKIKKITKSVDL